MFKRLENIAVQSSSFPQAISLIQQNHLSPKLFFDPQTYSKIFQKLSLKDQYPRSSQSLCIIDYHVGFTPFSYFLHKELHPAHHVIFPDSVAANKFWTQMLLKDPDCKDMVIDETQANTVLKHNFLNRSLELGHVVAVEQTDLTKVNDSILLTGNFVDTSGGDSLRILLFFNQMKTSVFQYNNVKFLAWLPASESLKFIGPIGSRHRRSNALMTNLFANVDVVAYSNYGKKKSVSRVLDEYKDAVKLPQIPGQKDVCLMEFQSNYSKYDIKFPDELHLIIHKMLISPSNKLIDNLHLLGPGAKEYLETKLDPELLQKPAPNITEQEFIDISEAYYYWPFKPNVHLETYLGDPPEEE
ncbi:DEKNAAC101407 [Brettanomyces naardenensis]|uniref:DEKNAAC101407 n=1 Tax=Brettanomyces naardenensis TaxID=13370 RepID=A0A448YID5_BRENA|nr:DEKNAAC101407 [Brettanomyces naardenensis]